MRGRVKYKRKVEERKEEKEWFLIDFTKLQRKYMKRNDLLLASPFLKYSSFSIYEIVHQAVENPKVFDEENQSKNIFRKHFRKKSILKKTSTWVTYQILTKG
jgi:hypothetical protein